MKKKDHIIIAPSVLSAHFGNMIDAVRSIETAEADWIHLDVMDGSFVPNITFGTKMIEDLRSHSSLLFDVHLMIEKPENHVDLFIKAGADIVTIHAEAAVHIHRILSQIREQKKKAGISIVPSTPVSCIADILPFVDLVLVMTVNPGFGGQSLIHECLHKIVQLQTLKKKCGYSFLIEVDGGVNSSTCGELIEAGAEVLVTGSAFFASKNPKQVVDLLRGLGNRNVKSI